MSRLRLLFKFIRLIPKARDLEKEYQAHLQEACNLQFAHDLKRNSELDLTHKLGFIEGIDWALKRFGGFLLVASLAGIINADTGFYSTIRVTETDNSPACQVGQIKVSPNTLACNGQTATITIGGGASGGASTLETFVGAAQSSPTASIKGYTGDFIGSVIGGTTFQFALNPATTDFIHNQTTRQTATVDVTSGTLLNLQTSTLKFDDQTMMTSANNFIQNQNSVFQSADFLINGIAQADRFVLTNGGTIGTDSGLGLSDLFVGTTRPSFAGSPTSDTCVGSGTCSSITTADQSTCMGRVSCLHLTTGDQNTMIGYQAGSGITTGSGNTYVGLNAGYGNAATVTGSNNTGIGLQAGERLTTGSDNTLLGTGAGVDLTEGVSNVCIGDTSCNIIATGSSNTAVGFGNITDGAGSSGNVYMGYLTGSSNASGVSQSIAIGFKTNVGTDNTIAIGRNISNGTAGSAMIGNTPNTGDEMNVTAASVTVSALPSGQCVQTGTGGLLSVTGAACAGGNLGLSEVSGNFTFGSTSTVVLADASGASLTVTLPTAVGVTGKVFTVKRTNSGANTVTVGTTGGQTIDGATTQIYTVQYTSLDFISNGTNWSIL